MSVASAQPNARSSWAVAGPVAPVRSSASPEVIVTAPPRIFFTASLPSGPGAAVLGARRVVLLQHRAPWSHHGGTWGIPGGARDADESAVQAALRETAEETGVPRDEVAVPAEVVDDHGGWSYTTVRASAAAPLPVAPRDGESLALDWVPLGDVSDRLLHPDFAVAWPGHLAALLRARPARS